VKAFLAKNNSTSVLVSIFETGLLSKTAVFTKNLLSMQSSIPVGGKIIKGGIKLKGLLEKVPLSITHNTSNNNNNDGYCRDFAACRLLYIGNGKRAVSDVARRLMGIIRDPSSYNGDHKGASPPLKERRCTHVL